MDWENIKILRTERNYRKRSIAEMIEVTPVCVRNDSSQNLIPTHIKT